MKTREEYVELAERHMEASNSAISMDGQRNMILAAQVYATLAGLVDPVDNEWKPAHNPWDGSPTSIQ